MAQAHDDAALTPEQLKTLRKNLEEARREVLARRMQRLADAVQPDEEVTDEGDSATHAERQRTSLHLAEAERASLARIDGALERMKQGTYGIDVETEEPIGFRRLLAVPWATRSAAGEEDREHRSR